MIFKKYDRLLLFGKKIFFSKIITMDSLRTEEESIVKDAKSFLD